MMQLRGKLHGEPKQTRISLRQLIKDKGGDHIQAISSTRIKEDLPIDLLIKGQTCMREPPSWKTLWLSLSKS